MEKKKKKNTVNIPEKVLKYETYLNDVLKEELKKIQIRLDRLYTEMAEYVQLKNFIQTMKDAEIPQEGMKTQVDIGCSFFIQAKIDDPKRICVGIGCGYFIDFSQEEALFVISRRVGFIEKQIDLYKSQSAVTKAHIKMLLLGLMELQKL